MTSFRLYHLANSRSQRILWLLEELELQYQLEICKVDQNNTSYQKLKTLSSNPKFPLLHIQCMNRTGFVGDFLFKLGHLT